MPAPGPRSSRPGGRHVTQEPFGCRYLPLLGGVIIYRGGPGHLKLVITNPHVHTKVYESIFLVQKPQPTPTEAQGTTAWPT